MIDTTPYLGATLGLMIAIAGLYYKIGKLEQKINLIYKNIDIVLRWTNNNKKNRR